MASFVRIRRSGSYSRPKQRFSAVRRAGLSDDQIDFQDFDQLEAELTNLKARHAQLDTEIAELQAKGVQPLNLMALKREKLKLKDAIAWITARLTPDIIA